MFEDRILITDNMDIIQQYAIIPQVYPDDATQSSSFNIFIFTKAIPTTDRMIIILIYWTQKADFASSISFGVEIQFVESNMLILNTFQY